MTAVDSARGPRRRLKVPVPLLPVQASFMFCTAPFQCMATGIGYGKTTTGALKTIALLAKNPGRLALCVMNSDPQLLAVMIPAIKRALKKCRVRYRFTKTERKFKLYNGATILCRSVGSSTADNLRGINADFLWIDEARDLSKYAFDVLVGRVGRREGVKPNPMTYLTTTPNGFDWIYRLFGPGRKNKKDYRPFHASTLDNPAVPQATKEHLATLYDERTREQELGGAWVSASATLYHAFDRRRNLSRKAKYDPRFPLLVGLDFNVAHCVAIICQERNGSLLVVDEIFDTTGRGTDSVIDTFLRRYPEAAGVRIFGDPSGHNRDTRSGKSDYEIWRARVDCLIGHRQAAPPIVDRVNAVNGWLYSAIDHKCRVYINPACKHLIEDLESVLPEKDGSRRPRKQGQPPHLTHPSDAFGYLVESLHPVRRILDRLKLARQDDAELQEMARRGN